MGQRTPPTSPVKVQLPDSPLHAYAPFTASSSSSHDLSPGIRTSLDQDQPVTAAAASAGARRGVGGHRTRPSESALLGEQQGGADDGFGADERRYERQQRLRAYNDGGDEGAAKRALRVATAPFRGVVGFVKKNEGLLLIACSQVFFAAINCCVKLLERDVHMPVWELIFIRMLCTFLGCFAYLHWTGDPNPFLGPPGVRLLLCARGVVGFFGLFPGYYALQYLSLSDATTISFLSPVLVGLLAWILLREPYSRLEALVGFTSLLGTLFIAKPHFLFPPPGEAENLGGEEVTPEQRLAATGIALVGVFGAAGAYLLIRLIGKRASPLHSISYFSFYSVVVSLLYPLVFDAPPVFKLEKRFLMLIVPIGIFGFLAQALLTMGLQREKAGRGTLAVYSNLIFAMILERVVFHKLPDAWSLLGACIIIGGAIRVALEKKPVVTAAGTISRRASVASLSGGGGGGRRRASVATVGGVGDLSAAEEGRKVAGKSDAEAARPLRLSVSDDGLETDEEDHLVEGEETGGSGIAAARGLDVER
ncbi:hypothetical protein JCM8097_005217 [Rhodosporidiobolus ruineniae]